MSGKEVRLGFIKVLLEHYLDVVQGLRDRGNGDDGIALMCDAWNEPGYQRLEELRPQMMKERADLYKPLHQAYFNPLSRYEKRVLACQYPSCTFNVPTWSTLGFHTHGRRHVRLVLRVDRVYHNPVNDTDLEQGVQWLESKWGGDVLVPDILRPFAATRPVGVL